MIINEDYPTFDPDDLGPLKEEDFPGCRGFLIALALTLIVAILTLSILYKLAV